MGLALYRNPQNLPLSEATRLAALLGLSPRTPMSDLALADRIAQGLPVGAAYALEPVLAQIDPRALFSLVSESTLRRAKKAKPARLTREPSERVYGMGRVIDHAARAFRGDEAAIARFLSRPNALLDGRTPFEVAKASFAGAELVIALLRESDSGVAP